MKNQFIKFTTKMLYRSKAIHLFNIGVNRLLKLSNYANTYQVMVYHRVNNFREKYSLGAVDPSDFEKQIQFLKQYYNILPLHEIVKKVKNNELPERALAITFDDGYLDNYMFAFPILKKNNVPATLFVTTDCLNNRESLWFDKVFYAFKNTSVQEFAIPALGINSKILLSEEDKISFIKKLLLKLKYQSEKQKNDILTNLFNDLKISEFGEISNIMINWKQAIQMDHNNFNIQSHGISHPILTMLDKNSLSHEIKTSKNIIESKLDKHVDLFAYPNGLKSDFNNNVIQVLKEAGYYSAFTTIQGKNNLTDNRYTLKRIYPRFDDIYRFSFYQSFSDIFDTSH